MNRAAAQARRFYAVSRERGDWIVLCVNCNVHVLMTDTTEKDAVELVGYCLCACCDPIG